MTHSAQDFARELTAIVDASANALSTLNRVLEVQQQSILMLASEGGVPAPVTMSAASAAQSAAAQGSPHTLATPTPPTTDTAPVAEASPETTPPTGPSPEELLAHAEKIARALINAAPEVAISSLYQASAHAVSLALLNTVSAQQQLTIVAQAVVTRGAANLLSTPQAAPALPAREKPSGEATSGSARGQPQSARSR